MAVETAVLQEHTFLRRLQLWLVLGNGVVATLVLVLVVQWQAAILHDERNGERSRVQGLALSISQTLVGEMNQVDAGLQSVARQLLAMENQPAHVRPEQASAILATHLDLMPLVDSLMVTDAQGKVRYSDRPEMGLGIDLAARAHFQQAREQTRPVLILSQALVSDASRAQRVFAVRRLEHADGSFAGIASAAINPAHFQRIFGQVDLGATGVISLRNAGRQILARVAAGRSQDQWFGNTEASPELQHAFASGASSSSFVSTVRQDGIERISAFQRVGDYPLMLIVGQGTDSFMRPWRAQVERIALLCLLSVVGMGALSTVLYVSIRRAIGGRAQLVRDLQHCQAWQDASRDGVHILDRQGSIVSASESLATLLGYHPDYLQGRSLSLLTALSMQALLLPEPEAAGAVRRVQTRYRRLDGSLVDVELYVSTVWFASGPLLYCAARDITHLLNNPGKKHEPLV